ncbi:Amidinotransferase [Ancylostoma ceylanicum]|uniref:Amidinotransferase n=1 Tax=Ancylostoma ceylanicum TaxID=53326 RepID=A0A0D6LJF6_9BILA|nr:Amidinotransferase [Ancylostoma ceylanicum]
MDEKEMSRAAGQLLKRVLMVPPQHFTVEYTINPWMGGVVDKAKAFEQWNSLKTTIEKEGVQVLTMDQTQGLPDQVFVCNSGLVHNNNVYLSRFRHKERTGEQEHYLKWFKSQGFHIFGDDYPEYFEGGGDAVFSDPHTLWAGVRAHQGNGRLRDCHLRADPSQLLPPGHVLLSGRPDHGVVVPTSVFGQHKERGAVGFPPVELARASVPSLQITRRMPDAIAISDAEANAFVCNAITVRNTVISPIGVSAATREALRKRGMSVVEVDMSEFMKSGGACQCLVLRL